MNVQTRKAVESDLQAISEVAMAAFGAIEGVEITQLIADLLSDASAQPSLSLVAMTDGSIIGHILFTRVSVNDPGGGEASAAILAPLAVHPDFQSLGIGGRLITEGVRQLSEAGIDLVLVLGNPSYYPKFGFIEARVNGFEVPKSSLGRKAGLSIPAVRESVTRGQTIAETNRYLLLET